MQNSLMKLQLPTPHCQNTGWTMELQHQQYCRFGSGLDRFCFSLSGSINFTFQFIISTGQTSNEFPRTSPMQTVSSYNSPRAASKSRRADASCKYSVVAITVFSIQNSIRRRNTRWANAQLNQASAMVGGDQVF